MAICFFPKPISDDIFTEDLPLWETLGVTLAMTGDILTFWEYSSSRFVETVKSQDLADVKEIDTALTDPNDADGDADDPSSIYFKDAAVDLVTYPLTASLLMENKAFVQITALSFSFFFHTLLNHLFSFSHSAFCIQHNRTTHIFPIRNIMECGWQHRIPLWFIKIFS